jgi:CRP-like cAMP-binding protein
MVSMTVNAARVARSYGELADDRREPQFLVCTTNHRGIAAHLDRIREYGMRLRYRRNETIFTERDVATHLYYVAGGCVRLCRHVADGRRHISEFVFAGDVFGLGEYRVYPYSAEAVNNITVISYPRVTFEHLGEGGDEQRVDLMVHFSAQLVRAQQRLFRASCQNARERTASFIWQMLEQDQVVYGERIDLPMGRQEIADHLGLTIETVCRSLAALRAAEIIDIPNAHQLVVKRPDELCAIAEGRSTQ